MAQNIRLSAFQYDIPDRVNFPNPCDYLRRRNNVGKVFAFRTQGSMWLVDRDNPPLALQARMEAAGCVVDLYPLDMCDHAKYLERAANQMRRDLLERLKIEERSLKKYDEKLAEAEAEHAAGTIGWDKLAQARRDHAAKRKAALGRTEELVANLEAAVSQFDIPADQSMFAAVRGRVDGLRAAGSARAEVYVQLANQLKGTAIGMAAAESEVPAGILADYAEENGIDATAVRELFDQEQPPAEQPARPATTYRVLCNGRAYTTTTDLTRLEAAELLEGTTDTFAAKMARLARHNRYMSSVQVAWLMILAERARRLRQGVERERAATTVPVVSVAAVEEPDPPVVEFAAPATAPAATAVAAPPAPVVTAARGDLNPLDTGRMIWNGKERMLIAEVSDFGLTGLWPTLMVRSHRTGAVEPFVRVAENFEPASDDGVPVSWDYRGPGGVILRLLND